MLTRKGVFVVGVVAGAGADGRPGRDDADVRRDPQAPLQHHHGHGSEQPAAGRGGQGGAAEGLHGAQGLEGGERAGLRLCVDNGDLPQQQQRW